MYEQLAAFPASVQKLRQEHLHFAVTPIPDVRAQWLLDLLQQPEWLSPRKILTASSVAGVALPLLWRLHVFKQYNPAGR